MNTWNVITILSVIMYYIAVIVLIFELFGDIKSEELCPNVKVELKRFPNFGIVEYTIKPNNSEQEMPLPLLENELFITLSSATLGDLSDWWSINLVKRVLADQYYWERTLALPMYVYNKEKPQKNYKFLNNNFTCLSQPMVVKYALIVDESSSFLMNQYGCVSKRSNDNMDKNVIFLILFNDETQFNLRVMNYTLTGYPQMLGILKIINISNEKNTDFENEIIFKNYLESCQVTSSKRPIIGLNDYAYIKKNDAVMVNDNTTRYGIILMFLLLICLIFIVKCLNQQKVASIVQN